MFTLNVIIVSVSSPNRFVKHTVPQIFYRLTSAKQIKGIIRVVWGYILIKLCSCYR